MHSSPYPTSPGLARRSPSARFRLLALVVLPFTACFAEPKEQPSSSFPPASVGGAETGGHHTGSGGKGGRTTGSSGKATGSGGNSAQGFGGSPNFGGDGGENSGMGGEPAVTLSCHDATAEPLPARRAILSDSAPPPSDGGGQVLTLTKSSLFRDFQKQTCGTAGCHLGTGSPTAKDGTAFEVTLDTFDQRPTLGDDALRRVTSSDPDEVMPPGSSLNKSESDPARVLAGRLVEWQKRGFPDSFTLTLDSGGGATKLPDNPYLLSPKLGSKLTNIGSCIPSSAFMLNPVADEMRTKDAYFAALATSDDLPPTIFETDLVSLDSVELSKRGVFSYAPTYPLYSDHAGKMRHVRVPVGQSIHYDESLHDFVIPDNTRFYKTFLKQVKDKDGNIGYRKMETRLIVVRQDTQNADGSFTTHALRASYAWDRNETMAHRVTDPFRDTTAAADRLCPYVVDESVVRDPTKNPISDQISETCEYMTAGEMADPKSGQIRHYAIPSTQRCDQCHMGSSSHSFILGFTPWQVDRRKSGEGGIYEDPKDDELTQLQRFLDYGVITGIEPGQAKLEESQGTRLPRNDYELKAQGYMMGNCAFCHNPNGFPVVTNPTLKPFELFPNDTTGGIFQFSLERYSPRAKAGVSQSTRFPYITAHIGDFHLSEATDNPTRQDEKKVPLKSSPVIDGQPGVPTWDPDEPDWDQATGYFRFFGPWRSLIWRNVYTPFTYDEDGTIFVHMPRNAAGFDCRAQQIMAEWMLSIPVAYKPAQSPDDAANQYEQPVVEVSATNPKQAFAYGQAQLAAKQRLAQYADSVTGQWCPDDDDLVDPKVLSSPVDATGVKQQLSPVDGGITGKRLIPNFPEQNLLRDSVPDHAHWVPTDTTEPPGKWKPRRGNWQEYIVDRTIPVSDQLNDVIDALQDVHLTPELEDFALEPLPMGTWHPDCQSAAEVAGTPTVKDLRKDPAAPLRRWLDGDVFDHDAAPSEADHVHFQSRGEAVFGSICKNCHGKAADSKSPLAATILEVTGGQTRVANFVAGLFGPPSAPGAYAHDEFLIDHGAPPEDWHARYVLFMGLGGTGANIPISVLNLVANSPFYGQGVKAPGANTPNMLGSAEQFCFYVLGQYRSLPTHGSRAPLISTSHGGTAFVPDNAHYELWESICASGNEPVVHAFQILGDGSFQSDSSRVYRAKDDDGGWIYPTDALVGDQRGAIQRGLSSENLLPWCVLYQESRHDDIVQSMAKAGFAENEIPYCPSALFASALGHEVYALALNFGSREPDMSVPLGNQAFTRRWTHRGAMSAGLAAFHHIRGLTNGSVQASRDFDFCR